MNYAVNAGKQGGLTIHKHRPIVLEDYEGFYVFFAIYIASFYIKPVGFIFGICTENNEQ